MIETIIAGKVTSLIVLSVVVSVMVTVMVVGAHVSAGVVLGVDVGGLTPTEQLAIYRTTMSEYSISL